MAFQSSIPNGASKRSVILLNSPDLAKYHGLQALTSFLDVVFDHAHKTCPSGKKMFPDGVTRFDAGPQQLVSELGPDGFLFIVHEEPANGSADDIKFVATGGARPFRPPKAGVTRGSDTHMMFERAPTIGEDDPNQSRWELISFGTDVKLQGQGLAAQVTNLVVAEIRKRVDTAWSAERLATQDEESSAERPKIVLLLTTIRDINEKFYLKRGWTTTAVKEFPAGSPLTVDGLVIVEMMKALA